MDACYQTINRITGLHPRLLSYELRAVTGGQDALGEVMVRLRAADGREETGRATSTDIIEARAKAYVHAINRLVAGAPIRTGRRKPQGAPTP